MISFSSCNRTFPADKAADFHCLQDNKILTSQGTGVMVGKSVDETGSVVQLDVQLEQVPLAAVRVDVFTNDTTEGIVNPSTFTWTRENWNETQTVRVVGQPDDEADGDKWFRVTLDYSSEDTNYGKGSRVVEMQNLDKDVLEPHGPFWTPTWLPKRDRDGLKIGSEIDDVFHSRLGSCILTQS